MSVSDVINSSFLAVFSFPFSQWNGGSPFSAGHRDQELEEQINPPWVASPRLVSCASASLSSLSVGAGSTAVGKARGLFSLAPLELEFRHPSLVSGFPSLESVCCGKPMPAS